MLPYHSQNAPLELAKKKSNKFHQGAETIIVYILNILIFLKALNLGTISSFKPCLSLPPVSRDDRKQFQWLNIVLNNKNGQLFLE